MPAVADVAMTTCMKDDYSCKGQRTLVITSDTRVLRRACLFQGNENRDRWVYLLIGVVCVPYLVTFFESLFRALFGNFPRPSLGNMAWVSACRCRWLS